MYKMVRLRIDGKQYEARFHATVARHATHPLHRKRDLVERYGERRRGHHKCVHAHSESGATRQHVVDERPERCRTERIHEIDKNTEGERRHCRADADAEPCWGDAV